MIGPDGETPRVDEMLQEDTFDTDREDLSGIAASSEMKSVINALKKSISATTGNQVPTMKTYLAVEDGYKTFGKTSFPRYV